MKRNFETKQLNILFGVLYAILMFGSIWSEIDMYLFIVLFVLGPIGIYLYVSKIYPKNQNNQEEK